MAQPKVESMVALVYTFLMVAILGINDKRYLDNARTDSTKRKK